MKRIEVLGLIGALCGASASTTAIAQARPTSTPDWQVIKEAPLDELYPRAANHEGIRGGAWVRCHLTPEGVLDTCVVLSERPSGWGFGKAATTAAYAMRMKPARVDGAAVDTWVMFPLVWQTVGREVDGPLTDQDALAAYPVAAKEAGVSGAAVASCAAAHGGPPVCNIKDETPLDLGFGKAASDLAARLAAHSRVPVAIEVRWFADEISHGQHVEAEARMVVADTPRIQEPSDAPPRANPGPDLCAPGETADASTVVLACSLALARSSAAPAPARAAWLVDRAGAQLRRGDRDRAQADVDQALSLAPDQRDALLFRAFLLRGRRQFDLALADVERALALDPKDAKAWTARAWVMGSKHDLDRAIADASRAIELAPDDADAYLARSLAQQGKGDLVAAGADLDKAVAAKPGMAELYFRRAVVWRARKDLDRAIADLDQTIRVAPSKPGYWVERGYLWEQKGDKARALADMDQAVTLSPEAALERGRVRSRAGDYDGAIADLNAAVRWRPEAHEVFNERCWARATWGRELEKAEADCDRAIQLSPNYIHALDSVGLVQFRRGNYAGAVASLDRALRLDPKLASSLYVRGVAKLKLDREADGRADIAAATALSPGVAAQYGSWGVKP